MISMSRLASLLLLLHSLVAPGLSQNPETKIGTGTISGKVAIEGKPAPGAIVLYCKDDERWERYKLKDLSITNATGAFSVCGKITDEKNDPSGLSLRREAEAANNLLELKSCQHVSDYELKLSSVSKK